MKQLQKENELTPAQKQHRQELKIKHQLRLLNPTNTNPSTYYFETKKDESIKDISASISFGMTFIFSFFMAGLTGYYFGVYFLGFEMTHVNLQYISVSDCFSYFHYGNNYNINSPVHYKAKQRRQIKKGKSSIEIQRSI